MHTEKQKMLSGRPYKAFGEELFTERQRAKDLVFRLNQLHPSSLDERNRILRELLGKTGERFFIEPPFRCDYGYNISIGENFYANYNLTVIDCAEVRIGDNVLIAPNVGIYTGGHPVHPEPRIMEYEYAFPVVIGKNVWIGGHVVINPGITIGDNSVIGAGSVVTRDIPSDVIAVGNPCKILRKITEEDKRYYFKDKTFE